MIYSGFRTRTDSDPAVVGNAEKGELQSVSPQIDISAKPITENSFEPGERSFLCITDMALTLIGLLLFLTQGMVYFAFVQKTIINTWFSIGTLQLIIGISFARNSRMFITTDQLPRSAGCYTHRPR